MVSFKTTQSVRRPQFKPVGIVDIGSNSVRLVVYDGLRRAPAPIFNEKLLCGLGRGVAITGKLSDEGIERALSALSRFRILCKHIAVEDLFAVATAAAREAENGAEFIAQAHKTLGSKITVLSGKKEARLAAMGVLAASPDADGLVGDLGGGSLEIVDVRNGEIGDGVTLPLGPLRLRDVTAGSLESARKLVDETFSELKLLESLEGRKFYAVGGAWRNLAKLHIAQNKYPLNVLHGYTIGRSAARSLAGLVSGLSSESLGEIRAVNANRAETLPLAALVLDRLLKYGNPQSVVTSGNGLREGLLYSKLSKKKRAQDPLLAACWDTARLMARSPQHERELCKWTDQLFENAHLKESTEQKRLRYAACLLADTGWLTHPNYRGERALTHVSEASFSGVDHPGRIFLALTVYYRYKGPFSERAPKQLTALVEGDELERARLIAAAQRLSYVLSGAMPGVLPKIKLEFKQRKVLELQLPPRLKNLNGERVEKRLLDLAILIGCKAKVKA